MQNAPAARAENEVGMIHRGIKAPMRIVQMLDIVIIEYTGSLIHKCENAYTHIIVKRRPMYWLAHPAIAPPL